VTASVPTSAPTTFGTTNVTTQHIALVPEGVGISLAALAPVAAAISRQVARDFGPIWQVDATVDPFPSLDKVPLGYWPVLISMRELGSNEGVHLDKDGQPYALVEFSETWSLTASHECLELLADPFCNRTIPGPSPANPDARVEFLMEICDPCQDARCAYTVNDILVSDFCTPEYFEPISNAPLRYSFKQSLTDPRFVAEGGYLSWKDTVSGDWWQRQVHGGTPTDTCLGKIEPQGLGLRCAVNARTPNHRVATKVRGGPLLEHLLKKQEQASRSYEARAGRLLKQIADLG
jgi:hypothetical protein